MLSAGVIRLDRNAGGRQSRIKRRLDAADLCRFAEAAKASHSDVDGSYTGNPLYDELPVQDADDL